VKRPVLIMAGGTGGHVFPGLAVAEELQRREIPVVWLGSIGGMESRLVPARGLIFEGIAVVGLRGKGLKSLLRAPLQLARALRAALAVLRRHRPCAVVSFGGYAAGPGGLASWLLRLPLLVHEQNSIAGLTNRTLARLAQRRLVVFPGALSAAVQVGNPVRAEIVALPPPAERRALAGGYLLVLGGSQGARALNTQVPAALATLHPSARPRVLHQCGERWLADTRAAYAAAGVDAEVRPFIADMAAAYAGARAVLCRSGATTVCELAVAGLGAVLVPFPHAVDDHQTGNARWLVEHGAAVLLPEAELTPARLMTELRVALDPATALARAEAARRLAIPDAAARVAAQICEVLA
jgi:UDP-N-acetylglucosamine--N-acetylmuramyl-(pentapeptide) pyrophosphoryl-undecaprenol N-acetylglucosamine transferase